MTYTEREIARLEGMKDGLIKKLVDDCEEINDQIIALRKGKPRKKDSEIYFDRGYAKGKSDMLDSIIQAEKNKYYCDEELCGESKDCSDCMVRYLEQLKKEQNNDSM